MAVRITKERNPRNGKPVTVVSNIQHNPQVIDKLSAKIKKACGAGGTVQGKTITVQGSHEDKIRKLLEKEGISRSEEHTSELQSRGHLVCRLLLEKKKR